MKDESVFEKETCPHSNYGSSPLYWHRSGETKRSLSESGHKAFWKSDMSLFELELFRYIEPERGKPSALYQHPCTMSLFENVFIRIKAYLSYIEPEGGSRALSISIRAQSVLLKNRYVFIRIRVYLRHIEPEGGQPIALYQNPGTVGLFAKQLRLHPN